MYPFFKGSNLLNEGVKPIGICNKHGEWIDEVYQEPEYIEVDYSDLPNCGCNITQIKDEGWILDNGYDTVTFENGSTVDIKYSNGKWKKLELYLMMNSIHIMNLCPDYKVIAKCIRIVIKLSKLININYIQLMKISFV